MHNFYTMLHMAATGHVDPATWRDDRKAADRMLAYRCFDSAFDDAEPVIDCDRLRRYSRWDGKPNDVFERGFPKFLWLIGWATRGDEDRRARIVIVIDGERVPLADLLVRHWPDASYEAK